MRPTIPEDVRRILLVLAALKLKTNELSSFERYLRGMPAGSLYKILKEIEVDCVSRHVNDDNNDLLAISTKDIAIDQVIKLLKNELKLTNKDLASALIKELSQSSVSKDMNLRSFDEKKSMSAWLNYINRQVGASELLRAATKVRNAYSHQQKGPWSLEGEGE